MMNKNKIVHMKRPAKKIPMAMSTPSSENPIEPLRINAKNPNAVVSALLVGLLQSFGILVFPAISIVLLFALMAVVLIVRPWGLFGRAEE